MIRGGCHGLRALGAAFAALVGIGLGGCSQSTDVDSVASHREALRNVVRQSNAAVSRVVGDASSTYQVLNNRALQESLSDGRLEAPTPEAVERVTGTPAEMGVAGSALKQITKLLRTGAAELGGLLGILEETDSLTVAFPTSDFGKNFVFGGTIVGVSDQQSETLGRLKLASFLPAFNVRPAVAQDEDTHDPYLVLQGCARDCHPGSTPEAIIGFPIRAVDESAQRIVVDIGAVGASLDLVSLVDPSGSFTGLKAISAKTVLVDFSNSTLVFDVESLMEPIEGSPVSGQVTITSRWYLRADSTFLVGSFNTRAQSSHAGYFATDLAREPKIERFATNLDGASDGIHYFVKNVPEDTQPAFEAAFDEWNDTFETAGIGRPFTAEFLTADDPRNAIITAGDPRFNVIEWDLINQAPYGGLGPHMAHQVTGQVYAGHVLVQGPKIVEIYHQWFDAQERARALRNRGDLVAADALIAQTVRRIQGRLPDAPASDGTMLQLTLGDRAFVIPSQMAELEDPAGRRMDFFDIPEGETYDTYMPRYWKELVAHELGHNIGLRHNFRGNLGATGDGEVVTRSVMEYLGRVHRHRSQIGEYDMMAIQYGYQGLAVPHDDWFCTDEDVVSSENPRLSAECSRDDATSDPFGYFKSIVDRAAALLVVPTSGIAPNWKFEEMTTEVGAGLTGLLAYASSANSSDLWTNWGNSRPDRPAEIRRFVSEEVKGLLCNPQLDLGAEAKDTPEGKALAKQNLAQLRDAAVTTARSLGLEDRFSRCSSDPQ